MDMIGHGLQCLLPMPRSISPLVLKTLCFHSWVTCSFFVSSWRDFSSLGWPQTVMQLAAGLQRRDLFVSLFFLGSWKQRVFGVFPKKKSIACICPVFLALSSVDKVVTYSLPWGKNEVWWGWRGGLWSQISTDSDPGSETKLCLPQFSQTVIRGWWWVPHKGVTRIKNSYSKHQMCSETAVCSVHAY